MNAEQVEQIVEDHVKFGYMMAHKFKKRYPHAEIDDLIGVAHTSMMYSIRKFDPTRGVKFITFYGWKLERELLNWVTRKEYRKMNNMDVSLNKVLNPRGSDFDKYKDTFIDELEDPRSDYEFARVEVMDYLEDLFERADLLDKERRAILLHAKGYEQRYIARRLNLSQPGVSRIVARAQSKLKEVREEVK